MACAAHNTMTGYSLDRQLLQSLAVRSHGRAAFDLLLTWGVIAAAFTAAHMIDRASAYVVAAIIVGSRQNALSTLAHEGWHGLISTSQRVNHAAGHR